MVKKTKHEQYEKLEGEPLPDVSKTPQMVEIEKRYGGSDIRLIIKSIYEETGSQRMVAERLGLEQSTITIWAMRLGIRFMQQPVAKILS